MFGRPGWIILGVTGAIFAVGAGTVLSMLGAHEQALKEQPRVQSLVETIANGELNALSRHGGYSEISFGAGAASFKLDAQTAAAIADYGIEARQISDERFRIQAWPRPKALKHGHAAAVSYFVDLSANGKILDRGWVGQDDASDE